jgi:hypothetical protein
MILAILSGFAYLHPNLCIDVPKTRVLLAMFYGRENRVEIDKEASHAEWSFLWKSSSNTLTVHGFYLYIKINVTPSLVE